MSFSEVKKIGRPGGGTKKFTNYYEIKSDFGNKIDTSELVFFTGSAFWEDRALIRTTANASVQLKISWDIVTQQVGFTNSGSYLQVTAGGATIFDSEILAYTDTGSCSPQNRESASGSKIFNIPDASANAGYCIMSEGGNDTGKTICYLQRSISAQLVISSNEVQQILRTSYTNGAGITYRLEKTA